MAGHVDGGERILEVTIREVLEEVGISVDKDDKHNASKKECDETHKIAVVYKVKLDETSEEFLHKYNEFVKELKNKEENPEFGNIVVLEQSANEINPFFDKNKEQCDEYMEPLLKYVYQ